MVGRKKRSNSSRNDFANATCVDTRNQQGARQQITNADFAHNNYRGQYPASNGMCRNGALGSDVDYSAVTATFRRRPKQYSNHYNHRNQTLLNNNVMQNVNGTRLPRSGSRDAGSASAGSVVSGDADEDGFLSGSGQELDPDDPRLLERQSIGLMTDTIETSSSAAQTSGTAHVDILLTLCQMQPWERVEAVAEMVQILDAHELRYLGSCVEAAVRSNSSFLRQFEVNYNDASYIRSQIQNAPSDKLLEIAFPILCLLHSTNRQAAHELIERLCSEVPNFWTSKMPNDNEDAVETLRLLVSAALHHAAFSVEDKIRLECFRNILHEKFPVRPSSSNMSNNGASTSNVDDVPIVITRLDATASAGDDSEDVFSIEIEWSDARTSYVVRTADQIADLHNRLLDSFPSEAGAQNENPRVLPYLNRSQPGSILGYIRALPDLPARVLVSSLIRDFFYPSRLESSALSSAPQSLLLPSLPSTSVAVKQKISANQTTTTVLTDNRLCQQMPLILSPTTMPYTAPSLANVPPPPRATFMSLNRPIPLLATTSSAYNILPPNPNGISCCNCAGRHPFQYCPQQTMLQVVANGEYRLDYDSPNIAVSAASPSELMGNLAAVTSTMKPPSTHFSTPSPASAPNSF